MVEIETSTTQTATVQNESNRQPVWHVLVLYIFTLFGYLIIWFYKSWKQLSAQARILHESGDLTRFDEQQRIALTALSRCNPKLRVGIMISPILMLLVLPFFMTRDHLGPFAMGIPLLEAVFAFSLFRDAARLYPRLLSLSHRQPNLAASILTVCMFAFLSLSALPGELYLLYLAGCIPLAIAQHWLNQFWQSVEPKDVVIRQAFTVPELIALIAGSILLGLVLTHYAVQN